ncbi:MAG: hypothetical protein RR865_08460 [Clostridia bacterium]
MQKTADVNGKSWYAASRCGGCFTYHRIRIGKAVLCVLLALLAAQVLMMVLESGGSGGFSSTGVSANIGATLLMSLVCASLTAGSSTRFLLRFGTPRISVWLCNVLSLMLWMLLFLLGTVAISLLQSGITLLLHNISPEGYRLISYVNTEMSSAAVLQHSLLETLKALPEQLLWTMETACLFYLLACCFRRSRGITLAVILGVPFLMFMMLLVPVIQQTLAAAQSGSDGEIMLMGMKWMQWLMQAAQWMETKWPWIQLGASVASLPLSYLCMRGTEQP